MRRLPGHIPIAHGVITQRIPLICRVPYSRFESAAASSYLYFRVRLQPQAQFCTRHWNTPRPPPPHSPVWVGYSALVLNIWLLLYNYGLMSVKRANPLHTFLDVWCGAVHGYTSYLYVVMYTIVAYSRPEPGKKKCCTHRGKYSYFQKTDYTVKISLPFPLFDYIGKVIYLYF